MFVAEALGAYGALLNPDLAHQELNIAQFKEA
jgi:hypothetical protein